MIISIKYQGVRNAQRMKRTLVCSRVVGRGKVKGNTEEDARAVSYTHLTLPTNREV